MKVILSSKSCLRKISKSFKGYSFAISGRVETEPSLQLSIFDVVIFATPSFQALFGGSIVQNERWCIMPDWRGWARCKGE